MPAPVKVRVLAFPEHEYYAKEFVRIASEAIIASVAMHNFWQIHNLVERASDFEIFARNMAIAGALLLLVGLGPGPIAIDTIEPKKKKG